MSRVLLGIDFGSASLAAARWATSYVTPHADVLLAHVAPEQQTRPRASALAGGLRGFADTLNAASVRTLVRAGSPSHWLSMLASDAEVSLLVLGRRAHANRTRNGEPNVIERVARRASVPVLVVPEGTADAPSHVVAAVDASAFAPIVVAVARKLATLHAIPLTMLHVLSPAAGMYKRVLGSARRVLTGASETPSEHQVTRASGETSSWLAGLARRDEAGIGVAYGDPAREITVAASSLGSPIIIVGMRGADLAPRGSIGSVARELLARSPFPVMAVEAR